MEKYIKPTIDIISLNCESTILTTSIDDERGPWNAPAASNGTLEDEE